MKRIAIPVIITLMIAACKKAGNETLTQGDPAKSCRACAAVTGRDNLCHDDFEPCNNTSYCTDASGNNALGIPYIEEDVFLKRNFLHAGDYDNWFLNTSAVPYYGLVLTLKVRMTSAGQPGSPAPAFTVALYPRYANSADNVYSQKVYCNLGTNTAIIVPQTNPNPFIHLYDAHLENGWLYMSIKKNLDDVWGEGLRFVIGNDGTSLDPHDVWGNNVPGCYELNYQWLGH